MILPIIHYFSSDCEYCISERLKGKIFNMRNFNRRSFLQVCKALSAGTLFSSFTGSSPNHELNQALARVAGKTPEQLADDEDFWYYVRHSYTSSPYYIDLNSAGVAPAPKIVHDAMKEYADWCNEIPSYNMRRLLDVGKEVVRRNLARICGCSEQEIALQRNATEALETVIFGLTLKAGDEVVLSKQDYPSIINAWKQRELRDGIKLVWVNLVLPGEDNEYLAGAYIKAFTPRTKVVNITHMINWNGQIIPVRKIADAAHKQGIEVIVDGAQSLAQFQFTVPELGADYFGASLHKWLSCPIGTGMLYVKKEKIKGLFAMYGPPDLQTSDITKFEHYGTHPVFIEEAINKAVDFYDMIGPQRKEQRLMYLKNYWMSKVKDLPNVELGTSMKPGFGCAIGMLNLRNKKPLDVATTLSLSYKVHTVNLEHENIKGVRISPNVFTSTKDLDVLVAGIQEMTKS
jgi:selenocysteine lyase/cysteine desulfurase